MCNYKVCLSVRYYVPPYTTAGNFHPKVVATVDERAKDSRKWDTVVRTRCLMTSYSLPVASARNSMWMYRIKGIRSGLLLRGISRSDWKRMKDPVWIQPRSHGRSPGKEVLYEFITRELTQPEGTGNENDEKIVGITTLHVVVLPRN